MAVPTNTYQTFQSIGNREDLIDVITNIDPIDTWLTSNTANVQATGTYHEWQTDVLDTAGPNAQIQGDDAAATAIVPTVRTGGHTQILRKVFSIAGTEEVINKAGRDSEIAYQTQKSLKALARDIEYALIVNTTDAAGAAGVASTLQGLDGGITTNVTAAAAAALTETMLNDNLALIWAQGGRPANVLCSAFQKRKMDAFTTNNREINAEDRSLVSAIDIYKSSFGVLNIRLHHQVNTSLNDTVFILGDMDLWKKAWLRPLKRQELSKTGDSTKFMMIAELAFENRQEKGSGKISGLAVV